jgi:hypothetical protein
MPIPAYRENIISACDYLVAHGFTHPNRTTDFSDISGFFVDGIMRAIISSAGIICEYDSLYYVDVVQYAEWRQGPAGPFGIW